MTFEGDATAGPGGTTRVAPVCLAGDLTYPREGRRPREAVGPGQGANLVVPPATFDVAALPADFTEEVYLELNPEAAAAIAAGTYHSIKHHWSGRGQEDDHGRSPSTVRYAGSSQSMIYDHPNLSDLLVNFNTLGYFSLNPDVLAQTGGNLAAGKDHWEKHGRFEGRIGPGLPRPHRRQVDLTRLMSRPFGINLFGPFGTQSGLGTASRGMAKAIRVAGIPLQPWAFDASGGELRVPAHHKDRSPAYKINLLMANPDLIERLFAAYPRTFFDDSFNIAIWQWELASFRNDWFYSFDGLDEVWSNSQFQVESIAALSPVPVRKVPLPVTAAAVPATSDRPRFRIPEDAYAFLMVFDIGSTSIRKNPFGAIEAFASVKRTQPSAHLVLKYHGSSIEPNFTRQLNGALRNIQGVSLIPDNLRPDEMDVLRASCDCLVSPHRSEGFGLNIAEFMGLAKPVIATGYSGNTDFFDDAVGFPIDHALTTIEKQSGPYRAGSVWAEPCVVSLIQAMNAVIADPAEARRRALAGQARIAGQLSFTAIAGTIRDRLHALGLDQELPAFTRQVGRSDQAIRRASFCSPKASARALSGLTAFPLLSVLLPVYNVPPQYLEDCIESVQRQTYPFWELCICNDASTAPETLAVLDRLRGVSPQIKVADLQVNGGIACATNRALEMAAGEFVVFLDNDDLMVETALADVVALLSKSPDLDVIYSDEDKIDEAGNRIDHYFKPDWSPEHLESVMYVLHMLVIRKTLVLKAGCLRPDYDGAQDYDLMLRCSRMTNRIHHLAKILYRWRAIPGSSAAVVDAKPKALTRGRLALEDHLRQKHGPDAYAEEGLLPGTFRARRNIHDVPVTLLILTGNQLMMLDGPEPVHLVDNFVDSILAKTAHNNYEIVVVDNSTLSPAQIERFAGLNVRVENYVSKGPFNYAAKANFAIKVAQTEQIVLLNDDMAIVREDWLTALLELSVDPEIGAVGARLLHKDGSIQHVGVVLGVNGSAAHVYHCYPRDFVGYNAFTHVIRNYSAVTAACLATRRTVCAQVGGFDENFAIDFNDIDFCLKLGLAGFRVAYTPFAELFHFEGASAKRTVQNPAEVSLFQTRWGSKLNNDPFYNVNLTRNDLNFAERA